MKDKNKTYDEKSIMGDQKYVLNYILDAIPYEKMIFVGGVADYLNLRAFYNMAINDLDIAFENLDDLTPISTAFNLKKYETKFYSSFSPEVYVTSFPIENRALHIDFFKRKFSQIEYKESFLLGRIVKHVGFDEMRSFHNTEMQKLTSDATQENYEWKRLYKHSIKASLYNNIVFIKENGMEMHKSPFNYALSIN